ncbi:alpha/beta fold hydrolase [Chitinophaga oryziterrae]|uniref:Alpha/beta fold hydrolase n=1 Tax=Chitinophaga oryziterrae TaxID=1031224 RepID=A0A6N8JJ71_9BACT|nr:alpha/beta fold hydrolase [Chitinophaga oryziterrae]MVT44202.1 alpha/beta fold hydrolase [Chitinophaga oryziterrae]
MKLLKRLLYFLLILFLLLNIIAAFHAWKFTHFYPPGTFKNKKPEQMNTWEKVKTVTLGVRLSKSVIRLQPNVPFETVLLHTKDDLRLEGWYIPTPRAIGTVILFHGYNACKDGYLPEAYYFRQLGYNTFMIDFRGNGNSEGNTCTVGYKEAEDVKLAYEYVKQKDKHIILWGMSMGAAAIIRAVPAYQLHPDKVILESSFATLTDAVKGRMRAVHLPGTPLAQMLTFWGGVEQGFWSLDFKPERDARQINMPALVCWGSHDTRVNKEETDLIYQHLNSRKKQLVIFTGSGHQSFCRHEPAKWKSAIKEFLQ